MSKTWCDVGLKMMGPDRSANGSDTLIPPVPTLRQVVNTRTDSITNLVELNLE